MLLRNKTSLRTDLHCDRLCLDLHKEDFLYFDKDGFELNIAEQKYYTLMGYKLSQCLNHNTFTTTWYTSTDPQLIIDHSLLLYRCSYARDARRQLECLKKSVPQASLLLNTESKWGFDFALDSIDSDGNVFEVLHIEFDSKNFMHFQDELNTVQELIDTIDWHDAARTVSANRAQWQSLTGFAQNDWKSKYILNWTRSEYTEKAI